MKKIIQGQGPTIVLSHALASDLSMWDELATLLSANHTVVRYDHRGHGDSPLLTQAVSIEELADDAARLIEQLGTGPVMFVGLSLGGMVGQALASRHPQRLRGLVVLNSAAHYPDRSLWDARIEAVRSAGMSAVAEGSLQRWLTPEFRATPQGERVAAHMRETLLQTDPASYCFTCEAIAAMDLRASNGWITTPTWVIAGRQDQATPVTMSQAIVDSVPNARLELVDGAHISVAESVGPIADLLTRWTPSLTG